MPGPPDELALRCPRCGYNLRALTDARCPECGEAFVITDQQGRMAPHPVAPFRKACYIAWAIGTAAIMLSWTRLVPSTVGWIGLGISVAAALPTYVKRR